MTMPRLQRRSAAPVKAVQTLLLKRSCFSNTHLTMLARCTCCSSKFSWARLELALVSGCTAQSLRRPATRRLQPWPHRRKLPHTMWYSDQQTAATMTYKVWSVSSTMKVKSVTKPARGGSDGRVNAGNQSTWPCGNSWHHRVDLGPADPNSV